MFDENGQGKLFKNKFDDIAPGDTFINKDDGGTYIIVSMLSYYFTGWLLVKRTKETNWTEVVMCFADNSRNNSRKEMLKFFNQNYDKFERIIS